MNATPGKFPLSKMLFILSIVLLVYIIIVRSFDVYTYAITGAIFEMTSVSALASLFILPIVALILWIRARLHLRSLHFYTFLLSFTALLIAFLPELID